MIQRALNRVATEYNSAMTEILARSGPQRLGPIANVGEQPREGLRLNQVVRGRL